MIGVLHISFDGKDDDGKMLPVGLYTVVAKDNTTGAMAKTGLVIARSR